MVATCTPTLTGAPITGPEAEFQAACGVTGIPLDLFEQDRPPEVRADVASGVPATGNGVTAASIQPYVFAELIAPMLGIEMPSVGSGAYSEMTISTALTAAAKAKVRSAVADGYKAGELMDVSPWPLDALVRSGIGPSGSAAVRAFQRAVLTRTIATVKNYSLTNAIAESTLRRDGNGNPAIDKARSGGRIDILSAAILAPTIGEAALCPPTPPLVVYTLNPAVASA